MLVLSCTTVPMETREHAFAKKILPDVDALALSLAPRRVVNCGLATDPVNLDIMIFPKRLEDWPAPHLDCVADALRRQSPFVLRFSGNTMDSGTETAFVGTRAGLYRIYKDTAGPFTLDYCPYHAARVDRRSGVACSLSWSHVRDLRADDRRH
jgi:hypothetical protein